MALNDADIDETIAADWAAIREKHTVEVDEEAPAAIEETPPADPEEASAPAETRPRDESGKFTKGTKEAKPASKTPSAEASPAAAAAPATGSESGATPNSSPSSAPDVNRAPSSWKPAAREKFAALDPLIKAEIHRREADMSAGAQQLLPDAQLGRSLRDVMAPYKMLIESEGGTPETTVRDLLRTAAIFRVGTPEQKYGALAQVAQKFGLDITVFGRQQGQQPTQQQQPQQFRDPRVDQLLAQQNQQEQQRQARTQQEMETTVNRWMNEVGQDGNPSRPYIGDVIGEMSALIPQIKEANPALTNAQALEEAYNRAIWAHPEIRALLQQKAAADLDAKQRADHQTRVRDARRAASVNVPRRASLPNAAKPTSIEDTIASTARELGLIT